MTKENEISKSSELLKKTKAKKGIFLKILEKMKRAVSKDQTLIDF